MPKSDRLDPKPFLVPPGTQIKLRDYDPGFTAGIGDKAAAKEALLEDVTDLAKTQDVFWASKEYALIIILQALDAAGKDSTIKHVMSGVNPQGVNVYNFKAPTDEERLHHFLWRPMRVLPPAGMIAIFNRSYYEEVLVVRVHPEFLDSQRLSERSRKKGLDHVWRSRYDDINAFEKTLAAENTIVLKFFLNASRGEQRKRFLARLDDTAKNWKFSAADLKERAHWDEYQQAYEDMLNATSTEVAPWYVIPADKKWFARACVADIISSKLDKLNLKYPVVPEQEAAALAEAKRQLEAENA
ncbi:MAG TPA: polyphosphate kinase 2 family protein [Lacipirellulaceae bacterium]|nr:polyphosphate kinase 2 family protein [Lacipirellulaceae bacterium]